MNVAVDYRVRTLYKWSPWDERKNLHRTKNKPVTKRWFSFSLYSSCNLALKRFTILSNTLSSNRKKVLLTSSIQVVWYVYFVTDILLVLRRSLSMVQKDVWVWGLSWTLAFDNYLSKWYEGKTRAYNHASYLPKFCQSGVQSHIMMGYSITLRSLFNLFCSRNVLVKAKVRWPEIIRYKQLQWRKRGHLS